MGFNARLTMSGLCLLVTDHDEIPQFAELLLIDTADAHGSHRHHPYMAFFNESQGNLGNIHMPALPGWREFLIGPDGRAITRVDLTNTIVRIQAETESGRPGRFVREDSMDRVPDLRRLGVTAITQPDENGRIARVTSRIVLPAGNLFTSGEVRDGQGAVQWRGVGEVAEFTHLQLRGLSGLTFSHGENSFGLNPVEEVVEFSITNEPFTATMPSFDAERHVIVAPHFHMFERVANHRPELLRDGPVTPSSPVCPKARWVQRDWPFLARGIQQ